MINILNTFIIYIYDTAIPVTGREGLYVCETSRLPHFLDHRLTDGGEVVRLTRRPAAHYPWEASYNAELK
jgi:hypothetical protein